MIKFTRNKQINMHACLFVYFGNEHHQKTIKRNNKKTKYKRRSKIKEVNHKKSVKAL